MSSAIVSLSGGQDSATCLAWAKENFFEVYTISFYYGQKHRIELEASKELSKKAEAVDHYELDISHLFSQIITSSALLQNNKQNVNDSFELNQNLPASFVPFRNLFLLSTAAAKAYHLGVKDIVTGICETDYSGYPDCRDSFRGSLEETLSYAVDEKIRVHAPLMCLNKAQTVQMMLEFGKLNWYALTHTCYNGQYPPCRECNACILREKGFEEAGITDPLLK